MGENIFQIIENGEVVATAKVSIYDFIPIVIIDEDRNGENAMWSTENCKDSKKEIITLSDDFDKDLREYIVPEIVIVKNSVSKIPLKIKQGYDPFGPQDDDGIVTFSCANSNVTIEIEETQSTNTTEKEVSYGDEIILKIAHKLGRGNKFSVNIKGKDDTDDNFKSTDKIVTSGRLNFSIIEKDVFIKNEAQRVTNEILFIEPFANAGTAPEYDENYCMQAAERSLSELFNNYTDFYSVDRSHKHRNKISFSGKNAIDRGNKFKSLGYVKTEFSFDDYKIDHNNRKSIVDPQSYKKVRYDIISLNSNSLQEFFQKQITDRIGYHIFYFTVTSGFHTLILIINNTTPCNPYFTIYDQHGETTSKGDFTEVAEGIRKQTSWTFANTCLNRYNSHLKNKNNKHHQWDSTKTILWKMQRK